MNGTELTSSVLTSGNTLADNFFGDYGQLGGDQAAIYQAGDWVHNGEAQLDDYHVDIPSSVLRVGTNTIGIEARNNESVQFIDARVSMDNGGFTYQVEAEDSDGVPLTYSLAPGSPNGMDIDPVTGLIQWPQEYIPTGGGNVSAGVIVSDGQGGTATQNFVIQVDPSSVTGTISGTVYTSSGGGTPTPLANAQVYVDSGDLGEYNSFDLSHATTGANGTYSLSGLYGGASYVIRVVPPAGDVVTAPSSLSQTVTLDPSDETATGVNFTCSPQPMVPVNPAFLNQPPATTQEGQSFSFAPSVTNPSGTPEIFELASAPAGMVVDPISGIVDWTPDLAQIGPQSATLRVSDADGGVALLPFTLTVFAPPVFTSTPSQQVFAGSQWSYTAAAEDPLGAPVSYSFPAGSNPGWLSYNASTQMISGTPPATGNFTFNITATTTLGASTTQTETLDALSLNTGAAPVFQSTPTTTVGVNQTYIYEPVAVAGGAVVSYSVSSSNSSIVLGSNNTISWTPTAVTLAPIQVTVSAIANGYTTEQIFDLSVTARHVGPTIVSDPVASAIVGTPYVYAVQTDNRDSSPLRWTLTTAAAGMVIDPVSGLISWIPTINSTAAQAVTVAVVDALGASATQSFEITVQGTYAPPQITSTPSVQAVVGSAYSYQVVANDPNGLPLTYTLGGAALANGVAINSSTGLVTWTPAAVPGQNPLPIIITASDGYQSATQIYKLETSASAVSQLSITSTPGYVAAAGLAYSYQVTASDIGSTLGAHAYSIPANAAPAGVSINQSTGLVTWSNPSLSMGGSQQTDSVTVVVTDNAGSTATQTYSLTVLDDYVAPSFQSVPSATALVGHAYEEDLVVTGGIVPFAFSLDSASLARGIAINSAGQITWTPAAASGAANVTVNGVDTVGSTFSVSYSLTAVTSVAAPSSVVVTANPNPSFAGQTTYFNCSAQSTVGIASYSLIATPIDGTSGPALQIPVNAQGFATYAFSTTGEYSLGVTATDEFGQSTTSPSVDLTVSSLPAGPVVTISSPSDGGTVTQPVSVLGSISGSGIVSYTLSETPADSNQSVVLNTYNYSSPTNSPGGLNFGSFDPTLLPDGDYTLTAAATNSAGEVSSTDINVDVEGNLKLGNLTLSFTDLTENLGGIPISFTRTYNSINTGTNGDFGYGWSLNYGNANLQTTALPPGTQVGDDDSNGEYPGFQTGSRVWITLPGGTRQAFEFDPQPFDTGNPFDNLYVPAFTAITPGSTDTLSVSSDYIDPVEAGGGTQWVEDGTGLAYNPANAEFGSGDYWSKSPETAG